MSDFQPLDLPRRPRRLRRTRAIRDLVRETHLHPCDLVQPLFVLEEGRAPEPVASMPGQQRWPLQELPRVCTELHRLGIRGVALFPVIGPAMKEPGGWHAVQPDNLAVRAAGKVKQAVPELAVFCDVALDPFTTHGHDGWPDETGEDVANDETVEMLCRFASLLARAGADFVCPSDMMDGRIGAIRKRLDQIGFRRTGILSYAAKYNSAFYGPFRDAVGSARPASSPPISKAGYQMDPANAREARVEAALDEAEGADILMVKPAGPYLDILRDLRERTELPLAAYQVSGEYAQLHAAADKGWLDLPRAREEALLAIKRAGADLIFTYFARDIALALSDSREP